MHTSLTRCAWCGTDPLYQNYHDSEWGMPSRDPRYLFELLCLEGQQAGLSWITVLKKRARYREQFFNFDTAKVAAMDSQDIEHRMHDAGLIRHLGKLTAIVDNARAWQTGQANGVDMVHWLWDFVDQTPMITLRDNFRTAPTHTPQSDAMSKALKKLGFRFVGNTTCYAFMQACGMVIDHEKSCFRAAS